MTARERLEGIIHKMRIRVLANVGRDKGPSGVEVLAVSTDDVVLDVVEVWLAASYAAWSRFAEEVLHALGDEEGNDKGESKASPAFLPLPELARNHGLSRETACCARTRYQGDHYDENDDCWDDQSDDRQQADGNLLLDLGVGDAQVEQREGPLERLDIVNASADASDEPVWRLVGCKW